MLHRCKTPTNRLCACGQVARELARRGIEADERRVPWLRRERADIEELTGQTVVPVLEIGGEAICDSRGSSSTCAGATMSGNAPALSMTAGVTSVG